MLAVRYDISVLLTHPIRIFLISTRTRAETIGQTEGEDFPSDRISNKLDRFR